MTITPNSEENKPKYPALIAAAAAVAAMLAPACAQAEPPVSAPPESCAAEPGSQAQPAPNKEGKQTAREPRRLGGKRTPRRLGGKWAPKPTSRTTD